MFFLHAVWFPALLVGCYGVTAHPPDFVISKLRLRQDDSSVEALSPQCNATCTDFQNISDNCNTPHCACTFDFVNAQGLCLLCQTNDPEDAADVQFLLDGEMAQCHSEGIQISYSLPLSPGAEALVQEGYHEDSVLRRNQTIFLALQIIGGHIGLFVILIFAVFSRRIRRDPTFLNFCITWIFSSIVFSMMLYRGTSGNTLLNSLGEVAPNACLAQAALTAGAEVMTASSTLALVIRLWISLRTAIYGETKGLKQDQWITIALLVVPYLFFLIFAIASVFFGVRTIVVQGAPLQQVLPVNFYCTVVGPKSFTLGMYGVALALLLITMGFDVSIISILYRHWAAFRHMKAKSVVSLSLLLRVIIFSLYRIVVAVALVSVLNSPPQTGSSGEGVTLSLTFGFPVWIDMLQAAIPLLGTVVLGFRSDMLGAITCWLWHGTDHTSSLQSVSEENNIASKQAFDEKDALREEPVKSEV